MLDTDELRQVLQGLKTGLDSLNDRMSRIETAQAPAQAPVNPQAVQGQIIPDVYRFGQGQPGCAGYGGPRGQGVQFQGQQWQSQPFQNPYHVFHGPPPPPPPPPPPVPDGLGRGGALDTKWIPAMPTPSWNQWKTRQDEVIGL